METGLISYLLTLLDDGLRGVDNAATIKAQIVKALKAMTESLLYGEKIKSTLEKSPVWMQYKDQKHDLFITDSNKPAGYLTGE